MTHSRALVLALSGLLTTAAGLAAQSAEKTTFFGVKAGLFAPGCVSVDDSDCYDSSVSYGLGGFVDTRLGEKILGGVSLDIANASSADSDFEETILDASVNLKADLGSGEGVGFRPGFGLGWAHSNIGDESLNAFTVRGLFEVIFPTASGLTWLGEAAVYAAPKGGTDCCDVSWGPGFFLRGGLIF